MLFLFVCAETIARTPLCSNPKLRHSLPKHSGWREMERLLSVEKGVNLTSTVTVKDQRTWLSGKKWSQTPVPFDLDDSGLEPASMRLRTGDLQNGGAFDGAGF